MLVARILMAEMGDSQCGDRGLGELADGFDTGSAAGRNSSLPAAGSLTELTRALREVASDERPDTIKPIYWAVRLNDARLAGLLLRHQGLLLDEFHHCGVRRLPAIYQEALVMHLESLTSRELATAVARAFLSSNRMLGPPKTLLSLVLVARAAGRIAVPPSPPHSPSAAALIVPVVDSPRALARALA